MPAKKSDSTWMKNHPLEGDNVISGFYNFLAKRNPKTLKPCKGIYVPDTVVFERNFPRGWYTTDIKESEVMRKQGKDLDASTIIKGFTANVPDGCPIAATYLCRCEKLLESGETEASTRVEVFNKSAIGTFLASKTKGDGILQKFIMPKGYHNSVVQVIWSPRVCMLQRRTNKFPISDKKRAEAYPFALTVTYEGPPYLSDVATVSGNVALTIKMLCGDIVQHFYYTEHKFISRMVLYFKADRHDRLWFLWCGSFRASDRNAACEVPVNLVTNFIEPEDTSSFNEDKLLFDADHSYLRVTNDEMFYEMYMKDARLVAPSKKEENAAQAHLRQATGEDKGQEGGEAADADADDSSRASSQFVQEALERIAYQRACASVFFEDLFYQARSYFTAARSEPFLFVVPSRIVEAFTDGAIRELMEILRITAKPVAAGDGAHQYEISLPLKTPITKLLDDSIEWINRFYEDKIAKLKVAAEKSAHSTEATTTEVGTPEETAFM